MALAQILAVLSKAGPQAAKQLPKLWPLLLESKNRERLAEFAKDLASASPSKRLRARVELTATLADEIAADAGNGEERRRAEGWGVRARNLTRKLNMPVSGRRAKVEHRRSITRQLDDLQAEMNAHLDVGEDHVSRKTNASEDELASE